MSTSPDGTPPPTLSGALEAALAEWGPGAQRAALSALVEFVDRMGREVIAPAFRQLAEGLKDGDAQLEKQRREEEMAAAELEKQRREEEVAALCAELAALPVGGVLLALSPQPKGSVTPGSIVLDTCQGVCRSLGWTVEAEVLCGDELLVAGGDGASAPDPRNLPPPRQDPAGAADPPPGTPPAGGSPAVQWMPYELKILEALRSEPVQARVIARRAGCRFNSHIYRALKKLRAAGRAEKVPGGYRRGTPAGR